jgi:hypothetical protein
MLTAFMVSPYALQEMVLIVITDCSNRSLGDVVYDHCRFGFDIEFPGISGETYTNMR